MGLEDMTRWNVVRRIGFLYCLTVLSEAASLQKQNDASQTLKETFKGDYTVMLAVIVCVSILVTVFLVTLCGGCTDMEVGSEDHAACGARKTSNYQYDSVVTDVNTQVMGAGHTLPGDPYENRTNALPYAAHPQVPATAQTFTGYSPAGQHQGPTAAPTAPTAPGPGAHRPAGSSEPPPPNYYEATGQSQQQQPYGW